MAGGGGGGGGGGSILKKAARKIMVAAYACRSFSPRKVRSVSFSRGFLFLTLLSSSIFCQLVQLMAEILVFFLDSREKPLYFHGISITFECMDLYYYGVTLSDDFGGLSPFFFLITPDFVLW